MNNPSTAKFTKLYKEFTSRQTTSSAGGEDSVSMGVSNCCAAAVLVVRQSQNWKGSLDFGRGPPSLSPGPGPHRPVYSGREKGKKLLENEECACVESKGILIWNGKERLVCDGGGGGDGEATDHQGSSDSGGSGSGKKQKSGSESSNSSSQQSGSGSRSGRKTGSSRSHSGSSDGSGNEGDDDEGKRRHPRHGGSERPSKDLKLKLVDEDDEATDSADEGVDGDNTPNSMVVDFNSPSGPQSNKSGAEDGMDPNSKASHYSITSSYLSHQSNSNNRLSGLTTADVNHFKEKTVLNEAMTPVAAQGESGTIAIESMAPKESNSVELSSAVNMIVGYGVPASVVPSVVDKSPPESDPGTPTLDSPRSLMADEKTTPLATPVAMTPVLSPALSLLPQVSGSQSHSCQYLIQS